MSEKKYTIGVDYGTLSCRAVVAQVETGDILASSVFSYPHGVMDQTLPDGTPLKPEWALQHPKDYRDGLVYTVREALRLSEVDRKDIIGIAVDFTACTYLPLGRDGSPLCFDKRYQKNPYAYAKLWKDHSAQPQADRLNELAAREGQAFLKRYGGTISSEWMLPKLMQMCENAPEIYEAADRIIEAGDWITMLLCGEERRSACNAGFKDLWNKKEGFPEPAFLKKLNPLLEHLAEEKLGNCILPMGTRAGFLTEEMAECLGLERTTAVCVGMIDAHAAVPAVGITGPNEMLMVIGTSTGDILCTEKEHLVPGICGVVEDGVLPGYFGYDTGQSCVGDMFAWFTNQCIPAFCREEAQSQGMGIHQYLMKKAENLKPGESGLLALDWWNGNRSILVDMDLTGLILGLTIATRPEEIYRALIEATAFGQRMIIENYERHGVTIKKLYACGGISKKNPMMMQIYADVCQKEILIGASDQSPALGCAIFAAAAAGRGAGGYEDVFQAARHMGKAEERYQPDREGALIYEELYREWIKLHDYFGRGENQVMKVLKRIRQEAGTAKQ